MSGLLALLAIVATFVMGFLVGVRTVDRALRKHPAHSLAILLDEVKAPSDLEMVKPDGTVWRVPRVLVLQQAMKPVQDAFRAEQRAKKGRKQQ